MDRQTRFDAVDVGVELVAALVEVLPRLGADLRDQVERAANSVVLRGLFKIVDKTDLECDRKMWTKFGCRARKAGRRVVE